MCGIFGQYAASGADADLIERMARVLAHRGPDGHGAFIDPAGKFAFGAGRLAIIDLKAPPGILVSEDRGVAVAFNGEIYNYKALRSQLESAGHVFATRTDTEVIVHGYEQWGDDVLTHLRGMFGVAIWDSAQARLLIARDRLGEKPMYYAQLESGDLIFASEAKALYEHAGLRRAVNHDALPQFMALGYVLPPHTLFAGIKKLAPGELIIYENETLRSARYWIPVMDATDAPSYEQAVKQVRLAVYEAVEMQMMSDVPIGAFLSGGVDSTAVVSIMNRALAPGQRLQTFTVGFDEPAGSTTDQKFNVDVRFAKQIADALGTQHHVILIKQDQHLSDLFPHLIYHQDDPIAIPSIVQTAYVAALARKRGVPVLLNGEAGDELFMGYNHFQADRTLSRYMRVPGLLREGILNRVFRRLPGKRLDTLRKLAGKSGIRQDFERYLAWSRILDFERIDLLLPGQERAGIEAAVAAVLDPILMQPKTRHFTDRLAFGNLIGFVGENSNMRVDKMSMAMSVEARSPLEDYKLVELALRLPMSYKLRGGTSKAVFKDAIRHLLPQNVLARPKWGFNPPASDWLRGALTPLIKTYLARDYVEAVGVFDPVVIESAIRAHVDEHKYELWTLWTALTFHVWHAIFIDQSLNLEGRLDANDL